MKLAGGVILGYLVMFAFVFLSFSGAALANPFICAFGVLLGARLKNGAS